MVTAMDARILKRRVSVAAMVLLAGALGLPSVSAAGEDPVVAGTISYTGARGPVSAERPILLFLSAFPNLAGSPVDAAFVDTNGGAFELRAPAAGDYYLGYVLDTDGDAAPAIGDPFAIYLDRRAAPGDPIAVPKRDLVLSFDDSGALPGLQGTATYTGALGVVSEDSPIRVEVFRDANLTQRDDQQARLVNNGDPYAFILLDSGPYYLSAFLDLNDDGDRDVGEPVTVYNGKTGPPGDPVSPQGGSINLTFADVMLPTPTVTPTMIPTQTATATASATPTVDAPICVGDCNGDGEVTVNEVIVGINIALGQSDVSACPAFDADGSGTVTVDEIVRAVNNALNGCPAP
jgi:hypothetical protein